ncbi:MAG: NTP transferase domain-containing protein, partial [Candidatus Hydrogenedentes bacterium]|nr:NTP transferase domain-containing protein [Candidatus Hydrogenedentota bacterium]
MRADSYCRPADDGVLWEHKLAGMTVVILAGGLGTRLRPAVSNCAKVLAEVDGRPFIRFILDQLSALGVKSVVLCTGYKGLQLQETLGESQGELRIQYSREPSPLG